MRQYLELLDHIMTNGIKKENERTGTGTLAVFGYQMRFDLFEGFPLLTTKQMYIKGIVHELLWMISGSQNIRPLVLAGVNIWNQWPFQRWLELNHLDGKHPKYTGGWNEKLEEFIRRIKDDEDFAHKWGNLGSVYGYEWRHWVGRSGQEVDQLAKVINLLKTMPDDRRMLVNSWDAGELEFVALPPCHLLYQFFVGNGKLSIQWYQRSVDTFLGLPFNIASYALFLLMVAQVTNYEPGEVIANLGDTHIYLNHLEQVQLQLSREPRSLPRMMLNPKVKNIDSFTYDDIVLMDYNPYPPIKAPISV